MDSFCVRSGLHGPGLGPTIPSLGRVGPNAISVDKSSSSFSLSLLKLNYYPFKSLFFGGDRKQRCKSVALNDAVLMEDDDEVEMVGPCESQGQNGNWVLKILHVRSLWGDEKQGKCSEGQNGNFTSSSSCSYDDGDDDDGCKVCYDDHDGDDDDEKSNVEVDRNLFTKMLKKVTLSEAKVYAQMSYLGSLAYTIPSIKPRNLLKRYGLRYVTSSIEKREQLAEVEKREQLAKAELEQQQPTEVENKDNCEAKVAECEDQMNEESRVRESAAFQVAASAASYLHSRTKNLLSLRSSKEKVDQQVQHTFNKDSGNLDISSDMASLMATTDSVTAVVAAKEEVKQAVADDLNSISSSPCEWYICDDDKTATRYFVIQGSETLASWQANLLFEPIQFEGLDVLVHRGIYEAAKGIYLQMLPEVHSFMKTHGRRAKFRFTGHSLGGSLSLFINLMLLMRHEIPYSSLLPVITFGSPNVMCGGDRLLRKLGLPKSHIQAVVMHRDIVPRAFSCHYPRPAAQLLKAVNGSFRKHPCLNNQKLLFAPMGEMLVLQPDEKHSPQHDLLPPGSGLYLLTCKVDDAKDGEKLLRAAKNAFLNIPHPLEILSDGSAYGNGGTIQRDHDMDSYLQCVRGVIRQELSRIRKAERERRRKVWWPLVTPRITNNNIVIGPINVGQAQLKFVGIVKTGRESLKRFTRLVASQHMHLLVVLLYPARLLLIGAYSVISSS